VSAFSTLSPVFIGAGIDDILGHRLATFESHELKFNFDVEKGREYWLELTIPEPYLNPGRYFLSVSLFSGQIYFDLLFHAAAFEVQPVHAVTGEYFEPIAGAGALRLPYRWAHAEAAGDPVAAHAVTGSASS
jgi:hypothetical protein